jgi:hypothetical protein
MISGMCSLECAVYNKTSTRITVCVKCGEQYTPNHNNTPEYCTKCKSSNHDSYNDLIDCFETKMKTHTLDQHLKSAPYED